MDLMHSIRLASLPDIDAIIALAHITWQDTYTGMIPSEVQEEFLEKAYAPEALSQTINAQCNDRIFLVCELERASDDEVISDEFGDPSLAGYAEFLAHIEGKSGEKMIELSRIYVDPTVQGRGIGQALFDAGLARLRHAGLAGHKLWLQVEEGNKGARAFYERNGFSCRQGSPLQLGGCNICGMRCERLI